MTPDQERWAEALAIEKWKGADAPVYVAERIGALALAAEIAHCRGIAGDVGFPNER